MMGHLNPPDTQLVLPEMLAGKIAYFASLCGSLTAVVRITVDPVIVPWKKFFKKTNARQRD